MSITATTSDLFGDYPCLEGQGLLMGLTIFDSYAPCRVNNTAKDHKKPIATAIKVSNQKNAGVLHAFSSLTSVLSPIPRYLKSDAEALLKLAA